MTAIAPKPEVQSIVDGGPPPVRRGWLWALAALVLVAGGLALAAWLAPVSTATQSETFQGAVEQVVIEVTGSVSLVAGDHTELTISKEWLLAGAPTVDVEHENGVVRVTGECGFFQIRCSTHVRGTVAADAVIVVRTTAGSVEVSGTTNAVDLETSAGSVRANDVSGPARLVTAAGSILGSIRDGDVEAETSAGRIELTVLGDFSAISAVTSAGDIDLIVADEVYDVDAVTSVGSVSILVRTDPSAVRSISAESSAGSISIAPDEG